MRAFLIHKSAVGGLSYKVKKCALCAHSAPSAVAVRQHLPRARVRINVFFYTIGNEVSYRIKKLPGRQGLVNPSSVRKAFFMIPSVSLFICIRCRSFFCLCQASFKLFVKISVRFIGKYIKLLQDKQVHLL